MVAIFTAYAQETILQAATLKEVFKLPLNVEGEVFPLSFQRGFECRIVLLD